MLLKPAGQYPVIANALTNDGIVGYYDDYYRIQSPAVTVTARGNIGHATARMTNFTPIVRLLTIISKHDSYFLEHAINNIKIIVESTGVPQLTVPQLSQYKIAFPVTMMEEKTIGSFFHHVDGLINLHQRQTQKLKKLKQGLLHEMFPREGESVPRLRFPGFTTNWKQQKLSDISDRYDNLRIPVAANLRMKGSTPYYGANGIQDYVDGYTHDGEFILVAEDGANDLKNYPINYVNGRIWVNNHAHVLQAKEILADNRFMSYAMGRADIESVVVGGGRAKLNAEALMNISLHIPSLSEQKQIGSFFRTLDDCIHCHEQYTVKLIHLKKGLLQKMFPQD